MTLSAQLAKHLREVYAGGNWTDANLRDTLQGISWQQATTRLGPHNTIAALVYHIHYYVQVVQKRMQGGPFAASDKQSFAHPELSSEEDWQRLQERVFASGDAFADAVAAVPDAQWETLFAEKQYGTWYYNVQGVIEHSYYHLGQIALLKKLIPAGAEGDA